LKVKSFFVAGLMLLGMAAAPAASLLFTSSEGSITFWRLANQIPQGGIATHAVRT
jgi:hypothetical protein